MSSDRNNDDPKRNELASSLNGSLDGRRKTKSQSDLLSALGSGAVNKRVQGRVLRNASAAAQNDVLLRLALRIDQIFAGLVSNDQRFLDEISNRLHRDEVPFSTFYRQIAVPLAHKLGDAWTDDTISMIDVEFATARLSLWCDKFASDDSYNASASVARRRIFLARTPGELHTLGLAIVAKCYRHAGWHVDGGSDVEAGPELVKILRDTHYDVVGVSVGVSHHAPACAQLVEQLRQASCNPRLRIGLGGPALAVDPHVFDSVGADFLALDALQAVEVCDQLVQAA